jgi:hypothetical protein
VTTYPNPDTDPAGYVLAVADVRERRASAPDGKTYRWAADSGWLVEQVDQHTCGTGPNGHYGHHEPGCGLIPLVELPTALAECIASEHNGALAEVALWRQISRRHTARRGASVWCRHDGMGWPCEDLLAVVAAVKAYAGDTP